MDNNQNLNHEGNKELNGNSLNNKIPDWYIPTKRSIYYLLGIIETLLAFRLIFKLLGASTGNALVSALYIITRGLIAPFSGIFNIFSRQNMIQVVFEPAVVIAMIVYALVAAAIVNLIKIRVVNDI